MVALLLALLQTANPKDEIQAVYDRWSKAYMARDAETLVGILSPDYVLINSKKVAMGYDVYVAKLKLMKDTPPDPTKYSTEIKKLTLRGDEADVLSVETMETHPTDTKTGKPLVALHRHEYLDVWIRYGAVWRLRRTTTQKESTEVKPAG